MNIAILIPELGGGGAQRVAQIIGDYYFEKGERVFYFLLESSIEQAYPIKGQIVHTGIKRCGENAMYGDIQILLRLLGAACQMRKWKWKYQIDVCISFMEECNYMNVLSKGREKVITRICTILSERDDLQGILFNKHIVRTFYNLADKVVVMSRYAKEDMYKNYKIVRKKLVEIPNPSIRNNVTEMGHEWDYGNKVVICVGRIEPVKQQERIVRAFSYVKSHQEEAKLLILGVGPNKRYLQNLCKKYSIDDSVFFIGFASEIGYYLQHSRVFVMASMVEGFPNSMVEAMAYGLPIVTMDSPGACGQIIGLKDNEFIENKIQYCPYGIGTPFIKGKILSLEKLSHEEILLGEAILKVLNEEKVYERYKERSLKRSAIYSLENVMKRWERLIATDRNKNFSFDCWRKQR